jgi:hypothetical protein
VPRWAHPVRASGIRFRTRWIIDVLLGRAKLEAYFECEAGRSFRDERTLDAEDESSAEARAQASAVLKTVSFMCVKLELQLAWARREIFVARNESDIERVPALLFPRAVIAKCGRGEYAEQGGDRKRGSSASNFKWPHGRCLLALFADAQMKAARPMPIWGNLLLELRCRAVDV